MSTAKLTVCLTAFTNLFANARQPLWIAEHSDRRNALRTSTQAVGEILFRNAADRQNRKWLQLHTNVFQSFESNWWSISRLCRRLKNRAKDGEVGARVMCGPGFV